jgi:hypothetical protein
MSGKPGYGHFSFETSAARDSASLNGPLSGLNLSAAVANKQPSTSTIASPQDCGQPAEFLSGNIGAVTHTSATLGISGFEALGPDCHDISAGAFTLPHVPTMPVIFGATYDSQGVKLFSGKIISFHGDNYTEIFSKWYGQVKSRGPEIVALILAEEWPT